MVMEMFCILTEPMSTFWVGYCSIFCKMLLSGQTVALQLHANQPLSQNKKFNKERRKKKKKKAQFLEKPTADTGKHTQHFSYDGEVLGLEPVENISVHLPALL